MAGYVFVMFIILFLKRTLIGGSHIFTWFAMDQTENSHKKYFYRDIIGYNLSAHMGVS